MKWWPMFVVACSGQADLSPDDSEVELTTSTTESASASTDTVSTGDSHSDYQSGGNVCGDFDQATFVQTYDVYGHGAPYGFMQDNEGEMDVYVDHIEWRYTDFDGQSVVVTAYYEEG